MPQESAKTPSTKQLKPRKRTAKKIEKGLGDTIDNLIPEPVKQIVEAVAGEDCGCKERKAWLNKRFAYFQPFSDKDKEIWEKQLKPAMDRERLDLQEQGLMIDLYQRTFQRRYKKTNCGPCVMEKLVKLEKAYEASCES